MSLKAGDILKCKKHYFYHKDCYSNKDERFVVVELRNISIYGITALVKPIDNPFYKDENGYEHIRLGIDFATIEKVKDNNVCYIWDNFHTKLERAKMIIKQYAER